MYRRHVVQGERCYVLLLPYILPPPTCRCRVSSEMTMDLFDLGSVVVIDLTLMPMLWRVRVGVAYGSINVSECIESRLFELFDILRSLIRSSFSYQWLTCKGISSAQRLSKVSRRQIPSSSFDSTQTQLLHSHNHSTQKTTKRRDIPPHDSIR